MICILTSQKRLDVMRALSSNNNGKAGQTGFTIIELVVVILLLGILTAGALPRFMDVTDSAHSAAVDATRGGFSTGVALFHAQWIANDQPSAVTGFGLGTQETNSAGYPVGLNGTGLLADGGDCINVFVGVLQSGSPSTNEIGAGFTGFPGVGNLVYSDDFDVFALDSTTCKFVYTAQGSGVSSPVIDFNAATGAVTIGTSL